MNIIKLLLQGGRRPVVALTLLQLLSTWTLTGSAPACGQEPPRPNILLIVADDLGYADVGFNGATDIPTPNLDRLAADGMVMTSGYAAHPVCGPSRAALLTGKYPHRYGAQDNLPPHHPHFGIPTDQTFLSTTLKQTGYQTGIVGKWHLGEGDAFIPNRRGFDFFYGFLSSGHAYFPQRYKKAYQAALKRGEKKIPATITPLLRNGETADETEYLTDAFSREACEFVKRASESTDPFFLYLAYNAPHSPIEAKEDDIASLKEISDPKRRKYAAMVVAIDRGVGRVVKQLKQSGDFENTLIIFMSDNGGKAGKSANNRPLRGGKRWVTEGGYRVPMFMHWPQKLAPRKFEHPVLALDFFPTLSRLAGAEISEPDKLDGKDIWDDLTQQRNPHRDELISVMSHRDGYSDAAGRWNDWKVVREKQKPWALYHLPSDIGERKNVAAKHPELMREIVSKVKSWSDTHQKPKWLYSAQQAQQWTKNKLPYFADTFDIELADQTGAKKNQDKKENLGESQTENKGGSKQKTSPSPLTSDKSLDASIQKSDLPAHQRGDFEWADRR